MLLPSTVHPHGTSLRATGALWKPLCYSKQYPRNSRSLSTFSCLTNTVMRRREPLPFLFANFLYILLILKASLRLTSPEEA